MNIRHSLPLIALFAASVAGAQTYPSFPGGEIDHQTLRTQEHVEELFESGAYERAYFIYRNELAPLGDKYAQYMIGYMHLTGKGVPEDPAISLAWYRLAAERGNPAISQARDELEKTLSGKQSEAADAMYAELREELSDRTLLLKLVKQDLSILRNSVSGGTSLGTANMTVIDRRYGISSGTHYYQMIRNRLAARLSYLKGQVEITDAGEEFHSTELTEIETELKELYAEIDARQ